MDFFKIEIKRDDNPDLYELEMIHVDCSGEVRAQIFPILPKEKEGSVDDWLEAVTYGVELKCECGRSEQKSALVIVSMMRLAKNGGELKLEGIKFICE